jgi:hypothetical protein
LYGLFTEDFFGGDSRNSDTIVTVSMQNGNPQVLECR